MKSNFNFLKSQLDNLKYPTDHNFTRYIRDLNFLLVDVEKKIYLREFVAATYPLRMAWDLSKDFMLEIINESEDRTFKTWNKNIKDLKIKLFNKNNHQPSLGYLTIWNLFPSIDGFYIEGIGDHKKAVDTFKEMNSWMHYRYDKNFKSENNAFNENDKSTLFSHRMMVRYNDPSFVNIKKYLQTIWYAIYKVMDESKLFTFNEEYNFDFDPNIYNDPEPVIMKLLESKYIDDLISGRKKCPICKEGNFEMPDFKLLREKNISFKYGAYLSCNHPGCWAKVDKTLKVKKDLKNEEHTESDCYECKSKGSIQLRYSLVNEEAGIYEACNKCSWNNKNIKNNNIDDEIKDIIKEAEEYYYDWDDYD